MNRLRFAAAFALFATFAVRPAGAYPTGVVFAPTGDVRPQGQAGVFLYQAIFLEPSSAPGPAWMGAQVGLLPKVAYGESGLAFGGLEVGIDAFSGDLAGTPDAYFKPVLNAKLQLVTEGAWVPHLAVGAMEFSPNHLERSLNFVYASATKSIEAGGTSYGRLTLGVGDSLNEPKRDPYQATFPVFYATAPFAHASHLALLGGYESPAFGPFNVCVDHIGGNSEVSATNLALNFTPIEGGTLGLGGFFGNDPNAYYSGLFAYLYMNFDVAKPFAAKAP